MVINKKAVIFLFCSLFLAGCSALGQNTKEEINIDFDSLPQTTYDYENMDNRADMSGYKMLKDEEHVYQYSNLETLMSSISEDYTGTVYFGFSSCPYCNQMVPILNYIAKEYNQTVTYVDTYDSRFDEEGNTLEEFSEAYVSLQEFLGDNLDSDKTVYAPSVAFIKNGEVVAFQVGLDTENDYDAHEADLTQKQKEHLASLYRQGFKKICS